MKKADAIEMAITELKRKDIMKSSFSYKELREFGGRVLDWYVQAYSDKIKPINGNKKR